MSKFKCQRCPLMCGYGPLTANSQELDKAPKFYDAMPEPFMRDAEGEWKDDLIEFCKANYKDPAG